MKLLIRTALNGAIILLTVAVVPGLTFTSDWIALILIVAILAFVNATIGPIVKLIALPIRIVSFGVATLVINVLIVAGVLWLAGAAGLGLESDGILATLLGAAVISLLTSLVSKLVEG